MIKQSPTEQLIYNYKNSDLDHITRRPDRGRRVKNALGSTVIKDLKKLVPDNNNNKARDGRLVRYRFDPTECVEGGQNKMTIMMILAIVLNS